MRESLLFVTERGGHRSVCLLPILNKNSPQLTGEHYGLVMERVGGDCAFRLVRLGNVQTTGAHSLTDGPVAGCLGILRVGDEDFICVVTRCTMVADLGVESARKIYRIDRVAFFGISSDKHDYNVAGGSGNQNLYGQEGGTEGMVVDPTGDIAAYLSSGYFYFSYDHDLTQSVQREELDMRHSWRTCSVTFFWNAFLLDPIREFAEGLAEEHLQFIEHGGLFVVAMQGYIQSASIPYLMSSISSSTSSVIHMAVISRLSCRRAGTRFRARGLDDDGHVANFVESEIVLTDSNDSHLFSYIILRGSVPLFWDQQGLQFGRPTFQITRSAAATQPAFGRHFDRMTRQYGLVHCLDLLSQKPGSAEQLLSTAFKLHAERYAGFPDSMSITQFDVNTVCRGEDLDRVGAIMPWISQDLQIFSFYHKHVSDILRIQKGVFRVNCQDCLDRTNLVQGYIVRTMVELFVRQYLLTPDKHVDMLHLLQALSELWANNGDALSMIYTGTGALRSGYTRSGRRTLAGLMDDVRKTAQRFYVNNFQDKTRQQAVDVLLGKQTDQQRVLVFNPIAKAVLSELESRIDEYSQSHQISVLAITWNCNGASPRDAYDSNCLLELFSTNNEQHPDIIAISFQEIVELSATQIMSVDPERRLEWESFVADALNGLNPDCLYSLLVSNQLVGTSLSLFVRADCIAAVRAVEIASVKTGFGGMAGNKGSVGIRLDYHDTGLCLVASHFTAGPQYSADRNREFAYITSSLVFSKQRAIDSHDAIIWMGDFNYRVELAPEYARSLIAARNYSELLQHDQLTQARASGNAFPEYVEPEITFSPTYKYDLHSNQYDTSEKMRTPSYCDRVMVKGGVRVQWYGRAGSIDLSDHRPVKALCTVDVRQIDRERLEVLQTALFSKYIEHGVGLGSELDSETEEMEEDRIINIETAAEDVGEFKEAPELPPRPVLPDEQRKGEEGLITTPAQSLAERIERLTLREEEKSMRTTSPINIPQGIVRSRTREAPDSGPHLATPPSPTKPSLHPVQPGSQ